MEGENRGMTLEQYKTRLQIHGYRVNGNIATLDSPYGHWVQRIVPCDDGFTLVKISGPSAVTTKSA